MSYIRKQDSNVIHGGCVPLHENGWTKPTYCGQAGWKHTWLGVSAAVVKKTQAGNGAMRFCKKCFKDGIT